MFAASHMCPSALFGSSVVAVRAAAIPCSSVPFRSASGPCVPIQYVARASFHADSKSFGFFCKRDCQIFAACWALEMSSRFAYSASGLSVCSTIAEALLTRH